MLRPEDIDSINLELSETTDMADTGEQRTIDGQRRPLSIDVADLQHVYSSLTIVAFFKSLIDTDRQTDILLTERKSIQT